MTRHHITLITHHSFLRDSPDSPAVGVIERGSFPLGQQKDLVAGAPDDPASHHTHDSFLRLSLDSPAVGVIERGSFPLGQQKDLVAGAPDDSPSHHAHDSFLRLSLDSPAVGVIVRGSFPLGQRSNWLLVLPTTHHHITFMTPSCIRAWTLQPLE
jgi:hypothetical protein